MEVGLVMGELGRTESVRKYGYPSGLRMYHYQDASKLT
jgi:hypothetical protein